MLIYLPFVRSPTASKQIIIARDFFATRQNEEPLPWRDQKLFEPNKPVGASSFDAQGNGSSF